MKKLPIGIQSFANIREDGYLYVDKTADIYRIISSGKIYFLSRPRRFGKSLLISTLQEIFQGNKTLFEGLYIYDKWDWSRKYPVIRIDWTLVSHATPEEIEISMCGHLQSVAKYNGITLTKQFASDCFAELIECLHRQTGERVVVLVDEYDVPVLDVMGKSREELKAIQNKLHTVYKVLKGSDDHLQFVFLTGVSKFSGLSIFSALNNPNDLTLDEKYTTLCGYTQQEMESYFSEYLDNMAQYVEMTKEELLLEIRKWYNGYSWDGETTVYNPFSTLLFFENREFANYWFRTGTPTFLIDLLQKRNRPEIMFESIEADESMFDSYDPANIAEVPLLFQTGYLTVKQKILEYGIPQYTLGVPNNEVKEAMLKHLLNAYTDYPIGTTESLRRRMWQQLRNHDTSGLEQCLREMIAGLPYLEVVKTEAWYHSIMLLWLRLLGFELIGEMPTNIGRIDAVWFFPGHAIVVEVKSQPKKGSISGLLNAAIKQIRKKRYYERFLGERQVSLLGVAFAGDDIGCRMETI
jgi:hypothetical protein